MMICEPSSSSDRCSTSFSERTTLACCCFFSVVILNAFEGSLVTFLSTPLYYEDVDTLEQLMRSDLPIRTSSPSFKDLLLGDCRLTEMAVKLECKTSACKTNAADGYYAGFQRINVYNLKYFKDIHYTVHHQEKKNRSRILHTMNECLISYFISYVIAKNSPYEQPINRIISRIDNAGLIIKWNRDVSRYIFRKYRPIANAADRRQTANKVFSLQDLEIAFFVLLVGSTVAALVFVAEICFLKTNRSQSNRHQRTTDAVVKSVQVFN